MGERKKLYPVFFFLPLLFLLLYTGQARAERHTVILRGRFRSGTDTAYVGWRKDAGADIDLHFTSHDGKVWDLSAVAGSPGFRLVGASMRFETVEDGDSLRFMIWRALDGEQKSFALRSCGENGLQAGESLFPAEMLLESWLTKGEGVHGFVLSAVNARKGQGARVRSDFTVTVTFETDMEIPECTLDRIRETEMLDSAFSMLEEGNAFLRHYQEAAESLVEAVFPLGLPYYYGGKNMEKAFIHASPMASSRYFRTDRTYLYGLDCSGFTCWAREAGGYTAHGELHDILRERSGDFCLPLQDPGAWQGYMRPGDLLIVRHGLCHVMICIGTLRTLGCTEEDTDAPEILDMPLVIHCGTNPLYYDRYAAYLLETGDRKTTPCDGGVTVSVIMPDSRSGTHVLPSAWGNVYGAYTVWNQELLVFPLDDCTDFAWYPLGGTGEK